jgi:predicted amidohydrolase
VQDLRLTLIQAETCWHDPAANRERFDARLEALGNPGHLVVLPEMFATGFTMDAAGQAETMDGPTVTWLRRRARELEVALAGSLVIEEGGRHYNRFLCALPDGDLVCYDKRHLFRMAGEHEHYSPGRERVVFELAGWRILPQVCYDLRFPAFCRNRMLPGSPAQRRPDYDLLLVVANWPQARAAQWRALLPARAIENLACVAGVNITGTNGAGVPHAGGSTVLDAEGNPLLEAGSGALDLACTLSAAELTDWRERFPAWMDADRFEIDPEP